MEYKLSEWPLLTDQNVQLVAMESPVTERNLVLEKLTVWTEKRSLELFYWNLGYTAIQKVTYANDNLTLYPIEGTVDPTTLLSWLLEKNYPGVFVIEGLLGNEALDNQNRLVNQIINAYYELPKRSHHQCWLLLGESIELPQKLNRLVPTLYNVLPSQTEVQQLIQRVIRDRLNQELTDAELIALLKACLGLPLGEIQIILQRTLTLSSSLTNLVDSILTFKLSKLRSRGLEFISEPDVPVGGLDLLEKLLDRAASLLAPEAKRHGLNFPKGIILWGPPGTGKSLSAKHAAKKMGVPLVAADWGGLISNVPGESEANLRYLLELVEVTSPCVLYWDDFDKAFAGWNSDAGSGVQRRLAGKLLTWMQERTAPVFVIATVNRLEMLPAELNRRFDDIFFVDLPHAGARKEIFDIHLSKYAPAFRNNGENMSPFTDQQWHLLLREYNLCSAAEIATSVRKAAEEAFYQKRPGEITYDDLIHQRQQFTPAMIREEEQILAIRKRATYARPAASPDDSKWRVPPSEMFDFLRQS
jgi:ATP-dependent 26S proteasome regulatory subunit